MPGTKTHTMEKTDVTEPPMYKVILNNDDYTTMDFVVMVLMIVFHKTKDEAEAIMINVHKQGRGLCGIYTYDVAETKVKQVELIADKHKFPLKCTMEEA